MEAITAADRARAEAMLSVRSHINRYKRSLQKYEALDGPKLLPYVPTSTIQASVQTRSGERPRLATLHVECEDCRGWEVEIQGGENDMLSKQQWIYCEHGELITKLSYKPTNYQAARPVRKVYQKRGASQFSLNTSSVTPEKLNALSLELDRLDEVARKSHLDLETLLHRIDLNAQANASELQRMWGSESMVVWLQELDNIVFDMMESAEVAQRVAEETFSALNSPSSEMIDRAPVDEEQAREILHQRLQASEERGFQADGGNLDLGVDNTPVSLEQTASVAQSLLDLGPPVQQPQVSLTTSEAEKVQ